MPLSRDSLSERQLKAIRRAQFRLRQTLDRLQWEEDILYPEIEALKAGRPVLGLNAATAFELVIDHADSDSTETSPDARQSKRRRR